MAQGGKQANTPGKRTIVFQEEDFDFEGNATLTDPQGGVYILTKARAGASSRFDGQQARLTTDEHAKKAWYSVQNALVEAQNAIYEADHRMFMAVRRFDGFCESFQSVGLEKVVAEWKETISGWKSRIEAVVKAEKVETQKKVKKVQELISIRERTIEAERKKAREEADEKIAELRKIGNKKLEQAKKVKAKAEQEFEAAARFHQEKKDEAARLRFGPRKDKARAELEEARKDMLWYKNQLAQAGQHVMFANQYEERKIIKIEKDLVSTLEPTCYKCNFPGVTNASECPDRHIHWIADKNAVKFAR